MHTGLCIQADAENQCDQNPDPAGRETGEGDGGDAQLHGLRPGFHHAKTHGDKIAGALAVDGEQGGQCQSRRNAAGLDQVTGHGGEHLGGNGARSQNHRSRWRTSGRQRRPLPESRSGRGWNR